MLRKTCLNVQSLRGGPRSFVGLILLHGLTTRYSQCTQMSRVMLAIYSEEESWQIGSRSCRDGAQEESGSSTRTGDGSWAQLKH